jgi:hypothetical protein
MPGESPQIDFDRKGTLANQFERLNQILRRIFQRLNEVEALAAAGGSGGGGGGTMDHALLTNLGYAQAAHTGFTPSSRAINTTAPLQGGGNLSADRTLTILQGEGSGLDADKVDGHHAYETAPYWGFPNRSDSLISFSYPTFTIAPAVTQYVFYVNGVKYTKTTSLTADITDTEGIWFFYFNSAGTLVASQTLWEIDQIVSLAYLYWDSANNAVLVFADERHGPSMDQVTHKYLHETIGTRFETGVLVSGNTAGDGDQDVHAELGVSSGFIHDEDVEINIIDDATPTPPYQQILTVPAQIPVFYRDGAATWRKKTANNFPVLEGSYFSPARTRCSYNQFTAGAWTQTEVTNLDFFAVWIFATNDINTPIIAILGQRTDTTYANAQNNNSYNSLSFGTMPFQEFKVIARVIFQTANGYANAPKARIREIIDYRNFGTVTTAGFPASTSHSSLTGLGVDDHLQYLILTGVRPMAGALGPAIIALTDAATIATDASLGNHFRVTLGDNRIFDNPTGAHDGQILRIEFKQDGTGGRTLSWGANIIKPYNVPAIVLSIDPNVTDMIQLVYNSSEDKYVITGFLNNIYGV